MSSTDLSVSVGVSGEAAAEQAMGRLAQSIAGVGTAAKSAQESASAFTGASRSMAQAEADLWNSLQRTTQSLQAQKNVLADPGYRKAQEEAARLKAEIDAMTGSVDKSKGSMDGMGKSASGGGMNLAALGMGAFAASQAVGMLKDGVVACVMAAADFDSMNMRLKAIEGSAFGGAKAMKQMQEIARQPGIGLEQASAAYAQIRSMNRDNAEAVKIIDGMAKANAAMGGGAEEFGRVMRQVTQMMGKGKISAEDMSQIAESMPNFSGIMQQAFGGMSTEMINARYNIDEILIKVAEAAQKLPPAGDTIKNNFDNIGDSWKQLKAQMIDSEFIKQASGALAGFLDTLANSPKATRAFTDFLTGGIVKVGITQVKEYFSDTAKEIRRLEDIAEGAKLMGNQALFQKTTAQIKALKEGVDAHGEAQAKAKAATDAANKALVDQGKAASAVHSEFAKFDTATRLKEETDWYNRQKTAIGANAAALKELEAVHKKRIEEINKKTAKKGPSGVSDSAMEGLRAMIAEKSEENALRARMDAEMIDEGVQNAIIARNKELAVAREKYRKLAETKGASTEQLKELAKLEAAELAEINKKGNAAILKADADADAKELSKEKAAIEKKLALLNKEIHESESLRDKALAKERKDSEALRKMNEEDAKAITSFAQSSSEAFATLATVAENSAGRQSAVYQTMFAISKAFAIAKTTLAMEENIADAMSKGYPQNIALMAAAAAQGAMLIADVQSVTMAMRETGGTTLGNGGMIVGEKRPEYFQPTTPGQIHNSTSNHNYGPVHVTVQGGGNAQAIAREIVRAQRRAVGNNYGGSH